MENRVFFPQAALDQWIVDGNVDLNKGELTILGDGGQGRRYIVEEAVRVMKDVSGEGDTASDVASVGIALPASYQMFTSQAELGKYLTGKYHIRTANELSSCEVCHR